MPMDTPATPASGGAYTQFPPPGGIAGRKPVPKAVAAVGVASALALGLAFGFWAKPDVGSAPEPEPMRAAPGQTVDIEIAAPAPLPTPQSNGKLEVLPSDQALAANRAAQAAQTLPPPPQLPLRDAAPPRLDLPMREPFAPRLAVPSAAPPPPRLAVAEPPTVRASFDCSAARSLAEQMVCEDPRLAAADRRMAQAYRRAMASGAPPAMLREDQADWLDVREQAARYSPDAVAAVYRQRIGELEELAADTPY